MTPMNNMLRNSLKDIEAHITAALAQQPEDDAKCGRHLYDALVYAYNAADTACHKARGQWRPAPATVATGAEISAELRDAAKSIRMRICRDVPPPTMCGKPLDVYFDGLADRIDAAVKNEVSVEFRRSQEVVAELTRRLDEAQPKPDPDWNEICAKCRDGEVEPEDCEYYGDHNGCNSPIIGRHPRTKCDTAKLREAVKAVVGVGYPHNFQKEAPHIRGYCYDITKAVDKCLAALATPPRNCDLYKTKDEAQEAFLKEPCGGKAELFKTQHGGTSDPDPDSPMFTEYGAFVRCLGCGCKTELIWRTYRTPNYIDAVIAVWNRRTP